MSRAIRWLTGHRNALLLVSGIWFLTMLLFDQTRWNAIATLWGILGAGLLVAVILQEQGEDIQRRVWLRKNAAQVRPFLDELVQSAGYLSRFAVGLPEDIDLVIRSSPATASRREALNRAREMARLVEQGAPINEQDADFAAWVNSVDFYQARIERAVANNLPFIARMSELHASIREFKLVCGFPRVVNRLAPGSVDVEDLRRHSRAQVAQAAFEVVDKGLELMGEAGLLKG